MKQVYQIVDFGDGRFGIQNTKTNKVVGTAESYEKAAQMIKRVNDRLARVVKSDPTMRSPFVRHFLEKGNK